MDFPEGKVFYSIFKILGILLLRLVMDFCVIPSKLCDMDMHFC